MNTILIDATHFDHCGGWVIDQQFMDVLGAPYLLAHGMGVPVNDATTSIKISKKGKYQVWIRTKEWSKCNNPDIAPGRFELWINNQSIPYVFGTKNQDWEWEFGGTADVQSLDISLTLHDLTGFEGRCESIILTDDTSFNPPNDIKELAAFRKQYYGIENVPNLSFDLAVIGGGFAGLGTSITAARMGLRVALIQDRPLVGGNNSSEIRVQLGGLVHQPPYIHLGNVVDELDAHFRQNARGASRYKDEKKMDAVIKQEGLTTFFYYHAISVEQTEDKTINSICISSITSNEFLRIIAPLFVDCTGDASIGAFAGADYAYGRESRRETKETLAPIKGDHMTLGSSVMWYSIKRKGSFSFPETPWAVQFNQKNYQKVIRGDWNWEFGLHRDQITDTEWIRDYGFKVIYGNWSYLKNKYAKKEDYAGRQLAWVSFLLGKRESRRLKGDIILSQVNIENDEKWEDSCVTTTWPIDLHYPIYSKNYKEEPFRVYCRKKKIKPFAIPYRCFYSRNIPNLFMAGRNISVTHVTLGSTRVMRTSGLIGEVVGLAASICKEKNCCPREVYTKYLDLLKEKMIQGVPMNSRI